MFRGEGESIIKGLAAPQADSTWLEKLPDQRSLGKRGAYLEVVAAKLKRSKVKSKHSKFVGETKNVFILNIELITNLAEEEREKEEQEMAHPPLLLWTGNFANFTSYLPFRIERVADGGHKKLMLEFRVAQGLKSFMLSAGANFTDLLLLADQKEDNATVRVLETREAKAEMALPDVKGKSSRASCIAEVRELYRRAEVIAKIKS
mmetsp:Transcript_40435/g.127247  ORF Transcript_40435/g.127247 Transcript_40435/m.127247 type:complete len:205 (-) Transcript_40435:1846-2460(-)